MINIKDLILKGNILKKTALILTLLGILSKIFGFGRYLTLAYYYGASNISDAYLISLTIPMTIFQFIGQGISSTFIPVFSRILENKENAHKHINNTINILFMISTLAIIISLLFTPFLVSLFAQGFDTPTRIIAIRLTRILLLGIYFSVMMRILEGYLHSMGSFILPRLIGLPFNIIIILSIIISTYTNIHILALGTLLAMFCEFLIILISSYHKGYRYSFHIDIKDPEFLLMLKLSIPAIISKSAKDINIIVDKTLSSRLAIGGISALSYATRLTYFIQQTFVISIISLIYPRISQLSAQKNINHIKKITYRTINTINLILIPATLGIMIFSEPIVNLIFGYGAFDRNASAMTSQALIFYSIGIIGLGLTETLSRVFFSLQDTKTPMKASTISMLINIFLNFTLSPIMGLSGLALATSIASLSSTSILFIKLHKKLGPFDLKSLCISHLKMLLAGTIMIIISKMIYNTSGLILSVFSGIIVYFFLAYILRSLEKTL